MPKLGHQEPSIVINGVLLTIAQAMTVRVAIGNFLIELSDPEFKRDLGVIGDLYSARLSEISRIMHEGT